MTLRAVIYTRYSSDNQREASIEDQLRLCKERLVREGWELVQVYRDAALSGASTLRPGYQALLESAREAAFDVVVAEALDRLSRDQEDVAGLFKRLKFAGIRLVTLAEGEISELHVGLKGTMNALFLKDLADKTRRGLRGRVAAGRSAGGLCYGYDIARQLDPNGEPVRGARSINEAEAAIVRRIFTLFAGGASPIAIAKTLNAEGVPGPEGRAWRDTTIRGHAGRGTGILRNELYIGRLVWNRMRFLKDPATGKRVSRPNPRAEWVIETVPELRIIDQETWERAAERLGAIRAASRADTLPPGFWARRRPRHVLTGKIFCGSCGGAFGAIGRDYLGCTAAHRQGVCANHGTVRRDALEDLILGALREQLMAPELVAEFVAEFAAEWNRLQAAAGAEAANLRKELAAVERKLAGLIDAIAEGFRAPGLQQQLDDLEARKAGLARQLAQATPAVPRLHPNLGEIYRAKVAALAEALTGPDGQEALEMVRGLVARVEVLPPAAAGEAPEIVLTGEIAAMVGLGLGQAPTRPGAGATPGAVAGAGSDLFTSSVKVVAGARFERATFRL
ncbi:MAG: recombinase family protein [Acidibrevibacterium sp.]|uniref:recombinase family protein n=1 Tax=Acidibrevibacterium fodinaquatile TaxID=1969806 RepID=UPI0023A8FDCD|nr:recombinase family protein [Acidibrevibacterium fodinaquatile]MCA7120284.1 recombinase family protein [Acidibrevibacterium fodinaquatile]